MYDVFILDRTFEQDTLSYARRKFISVDLLTLHYTVALVVNRCDA